MMRVVQARSYRRWFEKLSVRRAKRAIAARIRRIQSQGAIAGDWKPIGSGIVELRFDIGPGYRVYVALTGSALIVLLAGGDKSTQQRDIVKAKRVLEDWRMLNEN